MLQFVEILMANLQLQMVTLGTFIAFLDHTDIFMDIKQLKATKFKSFEFLQVHGQNFSVKEPQVLEAKDSDTDIKQTFGSLVYSKFDVIIQ